MDERGKRRHSTDTLLFNDDFIFDTIPEATDKVEPEFDPEIDILEDPVQDEDPIEPIEFTEAEKQLADFRARLLRDLRKHAEMPPQFKSKVRYFGNLQRLSVVIQIHARQVRDHKLEFSLQQLEGLRKELEDEGYAAGPPIDLGIEAARRLVRGPEADDTPRRTDLDWQELAAGERADRSDEGDPRD